VTTPATTLVHATAVAVAGRGVLLLGNSGAGKSDLALRLITTPLVHDSKPVDVRLISDDQVIVERHGDRLFASPPQTIAGQLEVRGVGIVPFPFLSDVHICLAIALRPADEIDRIPEPEQTHTILGLDMPLLAVDGSKAGAPARVMLAALNRAKK
jgi:serine kinase of HPr protein (carbohydrate metabolism regulator)